MVSVSRAEAITDSSLSSEEVSFVHLTCTLRVLTGGYDATDLHRGVLLIRRCLRKTFARIAPTWILLVSCTHSSLSRLSHDKLEPLPQDSYRELCRHDH